MITAPSIDFISLAPVLVLSVFGFVVLLLDLVVGKSKVLLAYVSLVGLLATAVSAFAKTHIPAYSFNGSYIVDNLSIFFVIIFTVSSGLAILLSPHYNDQAGVKNGEYYSIILFATVGMIVLSSAVDLILIFLGIEIVSISLYVLSGIRRDNMQSNEAALKYFLLGAFATGFLLYGMSLIYGTTGSTNLNTIMESINANKESLNPFMTLGVTLFIIGFGFKVAAAPFHMWAPDVYQGAPTPVTAFMAVGPKAASFAAFFRVFYTAVPELEDTWSILVSVLAVLSMTLGNLGAIMQTNIKRLLAFSSISHAGYILIALVAKNSLGNASLLFYMLSYAFITFGVFGIIIILGCREKENLEIENYAGLGFKQPGLALCMTVFLLSLGGMPPLSGFIGKFYIFSAALQEGHLALVIIAVLNSVVSFYYYLKVIVFMYMKDADKEIQPNFCPLTLTVVVIGILGTLELGVFPGPVINLAQQSTLF